MVDHQQLRAIFRLHPHRSAQPSRILRDDTPVVRLSRAAARGVGYLDGVAPRQLDRRSPWHDATTASRSSDVWGARDRERFARSLPYGAVTAALAARGTGDWRASRYRHGGPFPSGTLGARRAGNSALGRLAGAAHWCSVPAARDVARLPTRLHAEGPLGTPRCRPRGDRAGRPDAGATSSLRWPGSDAMGSCGDTMLVSDRDAVDTLSQRWQELPHDG